MPLIAGKQVYNMFENGILATKFTHITFFFIETLAIAEIS